MGKKLLSNVHSTETGISVLQSLIIVAQSSACAVATSIWKWLCDS